LDETVADGRIMELVEKSYEIVMKEGGLREEMRPGLRNGLFQQIRYILI